MPRKKKETVEKTEKPQKYTKNINFSSILINPSFRESSDSSVELKNNMNKIFENSNLMILNEITYERISSSPSSFFGVLKKSSTNKDLLTEIRDKKTNSILNSEELIFDHYTYFYIDYNSQIIAYIKTNNFKSIDSIINNLFKKKTYLNTEITPLRKTDEEISAMEAIAYSLTFCDPNDFVEFKYINKPDAEIKKLSLDISYEKPSKGVVKILKDLIKKHPNKIKKINVTSNEDNVDLIKNLFTREATIELEDDDKKNLQKIEELLKAELLKIINT